MPIATQPSIRFRFYVLFGILVAAMPHCAFVGKWWIEVFVHFQWQFAFVATLTFLLQLWVIRRGS